MTDPERLGPSSDYQQDINKLDHEPWNEHHPIDDLIEIQYQIFKTEVSPDPAVRFKAADLYLKMSEIEASIYNHGEAAAYAIQAAEIKEANADLDNAIAAYCVAASNRFRMGLPELGYASYLQAFEIRKRIAATALHNLEQQPDAELIARHRPPALNLPELKEDQQLDPAMALMRMLKTEPFEAFEEWLAERGDTYVAAQLRLYEAADDAGEKIMPLANFLANALMKYGLPKSQQALIDHTLEELMNFGPYRDKIFVTMALPSVRKCYKSFYAAAKFKRKERKQRQKRLEDIGYAVYWSEQDSHIRGFRTVPEPVKDMASIIRTTADFIRDIYLND